MTKANMMREAHKLAKTFEGNYSACLALALRTLNRGVVEMTEIEIVEKFLSENKTIKYGIEMKKVLVITEEIANDVVKMFDENSKLSNFEVAKKHNIKKRAMNELLNRIDQVLPSAFSKMK